MQTVEKLKYEGADLKLEMKDLKKVEKAVKVESSLYLLLLPCALWCVHRFFQICSQFWLLLLQCDVLQNAYRLCPETQRSTISFSVFFQVELESVRKLAAKMQEDSEELERERGSRRMEGVRERLLIMEKVESLSHLYLGGLEEVRADVFNVKLSCRDRVDKLEDQWKEFQQQQQETAAASGDELGFVPQQVSCITLPFSFKTL